MARSTRNGLRAEILLALFAAVVVAFGLLDVVVVRISETARARERLEAAEATAALLAEAASSPWIDLPRFQRLADSTIGRGGVRAIEILRNGHTTFARGASGGGRRVDARGPAGLVASVYVDTRDSAAGRRQSEYLLLYIMLTAGAILLLMYMSLTWLVVRPIDRLTRASERLAAGNLGATVPAGGSTEIAGLGAAFNTMATALAKDRAALVERLADLERTTAELREVQDQVVRTEKLASVGRLSAGIAHEIGNPLAAILGMIELLEQGDLPEDEAREFVKRVRLETERIHGILRELLDFARQSPAAEGEQGQSCALRGVVDDVISLVRPQKAFRQIAIGADLVDARVRMPEARLHQVLLNLLMNAADAIDGVGQVTITSALDGESVRVEVADDGPGVDESVRARLFEPFVTTKQAGKGTGLGLAVCHTIVDRAGGRIELRTRTPRGTCFVLTLPRASEP